MGRGADLEIEPDLASSWTVAADGLRYEFHLREGVRFHDGSPLTAEDVVATFDRIRDPSEDNPYLVRAGDLKAIETIEASDPATVVFRMHEPDAPFLSNLCAFPILPRGGPESLDEHPVGTGPFRFGRHVPGLELLLEANPDYFEGPVALNGIVLRVLRDPASRISALRAGEIDLIINDLPPVLVEGFEDDPDFAVLERPGVNYGYIIFNLQDRILSDVRVRQAIAQAIDRQAIVDHVMRGRARLAHSMLSPVNWAHADGLPTWPHDPEAARRRLDEAGWPDPPGPAPRFELLFTTSNSPVARAQAEIVREALRGVGIAVETRSFEPGTWYADLKKGNFQVTSGRWIGITDPDVYRLRFHSAWLPEAGGLNRCRYANDEIDRLIERGVRSVDREERRRVYRRIQQVLGEELPYIGLYHPDTFAVVRRGLEGVRLNPAGDFRLLWTARWAASDA